MNELVFVDKIKGVRYSHEVKLFLGILMGSFPYIITYVINLIRNMLDKKMKTRFNRFVNKVIVIKNNI